MMEPKIGEVITIDGVNYITQSYTADNQCSNCALQHKNCWNIACNYASRKDCKNIIFKEVEINMNEVKIQIPDNCELIKDGNTYIVKEKKQGPPRSWEEFCKKYPIEETEYFIRNDSTISSVKLLKVFNFGFSRANWINSKEEAEAFLALMQLRQLRKAWVGDWEQDYEHPVYCINNCENSVIISSYVSANSPLSFPTEKMTKEFLICFKNLCETAKRFL